MNDATMDLHPDSEDVDQLKCDRCNALYCVPCVYRLPVKRVGHTLEDAMAAEKAGVTWMCARCRIPLWAGASART